MFCSRSVAQVVLLTILLAHLTGCAAAPPAPSYELPDWVRVVVPERDGRLYFVGGVSFAADPETGVEQATIDAHSQIHLDAVHRFTAIFDRGVQSSGVETTGVERLSVKNSVSSSYAERMIAKATRDTVFYRPCGDADDSGGTIISGTPVCQVFVLMSIDAADWNRELVDLLATETRRRSEEGEEQAARLAEWLMREALEGHPEEAAERKSEGTGQTKEGTERTR